MASPLRFAGDSGHDHWQGQGCTSRPGSTATRPRNSDAEFKVPRTSPENRSRSWPGASMFQNHAMTFVFASWSTRGSWNACETAAVSNSMQHPKQTIAVACLGTICLTGRGMTGPFAKDLEVQRRLHVVPIATRLGHRPCRRMWAWGHEGRTQLHPDRHHVPYLQKHVAAVDELPASADLRLDDLLTQARARCCAQVLYALNFESAETQASSHASRSQQHAGNSTRLA